MNSLEKSIVAAWDNPELRSKAETIEAIEKVVDLVDKGELRTAEPKADGSWQVNEWVKKAIVMYFPIRQMAVSEVGIFEFHDKMKLKSNYKELGVRVVPPAVARYGAFLAKGTILMPSYVNIGAYVDEGTMVDTWATVGSCAQIGKHVHLSGGVGIGGVLEPPQASPVIIDVLGAGVTITGSSKIIDVSGPEPVEYIGYVPENSVVIPGSIQKTFAAGTYGVPCALIIGKRKESTDLKTSLNQALRENNVVV
jgi:2,3,4,5-tetrahydropyridine-2-carboxylate N-succinyltransferase